MNKSIDILKYLFIVAFFTGTFQAFSQKSKVLSAQNFQDAYYSSKDCKELGKAMDAIELALTHEASSEWAKTWYYRGSIYYDIYASLDDACRRLSPPALDIAFESYLKALELDEKERYKRDIEPRISNIAGFYVKRGVEHFNVKKYAEALSDFEKANQVAKYFKKTDTTALYNAALAAEKIKNHGKAALYYEGLIEIGYKNAQVYHFLANALQILGDTSKSFEIIKKGRAAFPSNQDLIIDELNYYLANGQQQLAIDNLGKAIVSMPDNAELYSTRGSLFDTQGMLDEAIVDYERALKLNPNHFNANYNLGALYFNKGVETIDKANNLPETKITEFKAMVAEADGYFAKSLPYLEKANEVNPHDRDTMVSLKNLYSRMGNEEGYKRISEILDN